MRALSDFSASITQNRYFQGLIIFLILLSAILIGIETYPKLALEYSHTLLLMDRVIIFIFGFEILFKILSHGNKPLNFFSDPWNVFDFTVVAICLIPAIDTHFVAVLRIVRVLRILRMISIFPKLRILIGALLRSIPSMGYVIILLAILFYMYAVLGVFFFGKTDPTHFGDLHHALITLFKVITLEGWTDIMNLHIYSGGDENGKIVTLWPFLYFASFILVGAMIIMNLFIGVIMKSMEESQNEISREIKEIKLIDHAVDDQLENIIDRLDELKNDILKIKSNRS